MPNWASGCVRVEGDPKDIEEFCKLFLFFDTDSMSQYFARSFIHQKWGEFKKEYLGGNIAEFGVEFAWSGHSCLVEGYPNGEECITLIEACKKHKVKVAIDTEESGFAFEEHIQCDRDGDLIEESNYMPTYVCACGEEISFPTNYDCLDEEECWKCEKVGNWRKK
ncbi:MAG: hypothetical protein GWP15_03850 [Nitrospirae bacterium]|nr:hypothetical protein [Nitrospirota bacterium]